MSPLRLITLLPLLLVLAACSSTGSKPPSAFESAKVAPGGYYKIGQPYKIKGRWYRPEERFDLVEKGEASWYGPGFHGKRTANGEIYDQHALTAAHRTLQLPSIVRVTNRRNNRSVVVRINDRGPFAHDRIIDLSRAAAERLDMITSGVAPVTVEVLRAESLQLAEAARAGNPQGRGVIDLAALNGDRPAAPAREVKPPVAILARATPAPSPDFAETVKDLAAAAAPVQQAAAEELPAVLVYVQAGAFLQYENAARLADRLAVYGAPILSETQRGDMRLYRVRLGPFQDRYQAESLMADLAAAGHRGTTLVLDR